MIVRLHYADGKTEDHPLVNGEQLADYVGSQNGSKAALGALFDHVEPRLPDGAVRQDIPGSA